MSSFIEPVCHKCGRKFEVGEEAEILTMAVTQTSGERAYFTERRVLACPDGQHKGVIESD